MISVYDNFLPANVFEGVVKKIKSLDFMSATNHPDITKDSHEHWPGVRTKLLSTVAETTDRIILKSINNTGNKFLWGAYDYKLYAHLKLATDKGEDYIHQDGDWDFAFLYYLSETNLNSGTKFYFNDEDKNNEHTLVKFVQNRLLIYDAKIPHCPWGKYGKDLSDGRLTINGFGRMNDS